MRKSILLLLLAATIFSCSPSKSKVSTEEPTQSVENSSIETSIKNINAKVSSVYQNRVLRLAVLPFVSTAKESKGDNFGEYLTESITSSLGAEKEKIKLFERNRLNDILSEAALSQTGIIADSDVKKIGELAPLDYILMGTYTKLDKFIDINGRLTDVVSGEIVFSFSERVAVNSEMASFFVESNDTTTIIEREIITNGMKKDPCIEKYNTAEMLVKDLSTPEKIEKCAAYAITTPFFDDCGIQSLVASHFAYYKKSTDAYTAFIYKSLLESDQVMDFKKAKNILHFLRSNGEISDKDWEAGLRVASKGNKREVLRLFEQLFIPETKFVVDKQRVDEVIALLKKGKIGTPVPVTFEEFFIRFSKSLHHYQSDDVRLALYTYTTYKSGLEGSKTKEVNKFLEKLYKSANTAMKGKVFDEMVANFNNSKPSAATTYGLYDFAVDLKELSESEKVSIEIHDIAAYHLTQLKVKCKDQFSQSMQYDTYLHRSKKMFYLSQGITSPVLPTIEKLSEDLYSSDIDTQIVAAELLSEIGNKAKPAKEKALRVIKRQDRLKNSKGYSLVDYCITIVINIGEYDKEVIKTVLNSRFGKYSRKSDEAITQIGKPAVPYLIKELKNDDIKVQKAAIKSLSAIGKPAKDAESALKALQKSTKNETLVMLINDALDQILGIYRD